MEERLRSLRRALDLTQQEFADKIGVKRGAIANYEIGRNIPVDSVISLICCKFNVSEDWLRNGIGEMFLPDAETELDKLVMKYHLSPGIRAFISKLISLPSESQEILISFMKDVVDSISDSEGDFPESGAAWKESPEEKRRRLHDELDRQLDEEEEAEERSEVS